MLSFLFDLLMSSLIVLMVYSLLRWVGMHENAAGFISGCLFSWIMGVLHTRSSQMAGDDDSDG